MARFGFGWNNMVDPAMWLLGFVCSVMLENQIQGLVTEGYKMQKWQGWLENASEFFFGMLLVCLCAATSVYSSRKPCFCMLFAVFSILNRIFQFCGGKSQVKMNEVSLVFCCNMTGKRDGKPCCYCFVLTENHGQKICNVMWYKYGS